MPPPNRTAPWPTGPPPDRTLALTTPLRQRLGLNPEAARDLAGQKEPAHDVVPSGVKTVTRVFPPRENAIGKRIFDGNGWRTFDPTPASLRPGNTQTGLLRVYASALSDSINSFWERYILTFGLADQIALIVDFIGRTRDLAAALHSGGAQTIRALLTRRFAGALLAVIACGAVLIWIARRRRPIFALLAAHLHGLGFRSAMR